MKAGGTGEEQHCRSAIAPRPRSGGPYVLAGFSIELPYDSGKTERRNFAISTDNNHVFARLDGEMMPKK